MGLIYNVLHDADIEYEPQGRYAAETKVLATLASYALNKEKNACKPRFETLDLQDILTLLSLEFQELKIEIWEKERSYELILQEMADCAACLVGMYANIQEKMRLRRESRDEI